MKSLLKFDLKWILFLLIISVSWVNFNNKKWVSKKVIDIDVISYNAYLPAFFYEKDLTLSFLNDSTKPNRDNLYYPIRIGDDKIVIKMPMGMAISYLPFFTMAHYYCKTNNIPTDGFSEPYQFAIQFSSLFYAILGFIFLWKVLRKYFDQNISAFVLLCILFATNLFFYLTVAAGMSHAVGFAFISMFIYYTIKWHNTPNLKYSFLLGCIAGYLTLVRPINILVVIFFVLHEIKSFDDFKNRIIFFIKQFKYLLLIMIIGITVFSPQLFYWKHATGEYFFYSYTSEKFYFNNPHILKGLFSFRKGWLIYTPIMLFALIGIFVLAKKYKQLFFSILTVIIIYLYVAFSWWCWWYGGSFGQRALIDIYPFMALPLAALVNVIHNKRIKIIFYSISVILIALNLFQTVQAKFNVIHYDSMTYKSYVRYFFTTKTPTDAEPYLQHPDYEKAMRGEDE